LGRFQERQGEEAFRGLLGFRTFVQTSHIGEPPHPGRGLKKLAVEARSLSRYPFGFRKPVVPNMMAWHQVPLSPSSEYHDPRHRDSPSTPRESAPIPTVLDPSARNSPVPPDVPPEFEDVVGQADQVPLGLDLLKPSQEKGANAPGLLDLAEDRLNALLAL
jgi:hypothetical protein